MNSNEDEFPPNASVKLSKVFEDQNDESNLSSDFSNLFLPKKRTEMSNSCPINLIHAYVVNCYLLKKSGYEDIGNCGLALLGNDSSAYYIIFVYKKNNSKVCQIGIQPDLELEVESKNYLCFKDADDLYWSLYFKKEQDLHDFIEKVLVLRWKVLSANLVKKSQALSSMSAILQKSCKGEGKRVSHKRPIRSHLMYANFTNDSLAEKSPERVLDDFKLPTPILSKMPKRLRIDDEFIMIATRSVIDFVKDEATNQQLTAYIKIKITGNDACGENGTDQSEVESCAPSVPASRSMSPIAQRNARTCCADFKTETSLDIGTPAVVSTPTATPSKLPSQNTEETNILTDKLDSLMSMVDSLESKLLKKTSEMEERMRSLEEHIRSLSAANHVSSQVVKESQNKIIEGVLSKLIVFKNEISQQLKDDIEVGLSESANQIKELKGASEKIVDLLEQANHSATSSQLEKNVKELTSILPKLPEFDAADMLMSSLSSTSLGGDHDTPPRLPPSPKFNVLGGNDLAKSDSDSDDY